MKPRARYRLPDDWTLTDDWRQAAADARERNSLPPVDLDLEAEKFANHFHAKSGQHATKIDWRATWVNWALKAEPPRGKPNGADHPLSTTAIQRRYLEAHAARARSSDPFDAWGDDDVPEAEANRNGGGRPDLPRGD